MTEKQQCLNYQANRITSKIGNSTLTPKTPAKKMCFKFPEINTNKFMLTATDKLDIDTPLKKCNLNDEKKVTESNKCNVGYELNDDKTKNSNDCDWSAISNINLHEYGKIDKNFNNDNFDENCINYVKNTNFVTHDFEIFSVYNDNDNIFSKKIKLSLKAKKMHKNFYKTNYEDLGLIGNGDFCLVYLVCNKKNVNICGTDSKKELNINDAECISENNIIKDKTVIKNSNHFDYKGNVSNLDNEKNKSFAIAKINNENVVNVRNREKCFETLSLTGNNSKNNFVSSYNNLSKGVEREDQSILTDLNSFSNQNNTDNFIDIKSIFKNILSKDDGEDNKKNKKRCKINKHETNNSKTNGDRRISINQNVIKNLSGNIKKEYNSKATSNKANHAVYSEADVKNMYNSNDNANGNCGLNNSFTFPFRNPRFEKLNLINDLFNNKYKNKLCKNDKSLRCVRKNRARIKGKLDLAQKLNEVKIMCTLKDKPQILKFYRIWVENMHLHFELEFYPNGTLREYIEYCFQKHGKINKQLKNKIMFDLSMGLKHIHENKIVHGDLKPENIFINNINAKTCNGNCTCDFYPKFNFLEFVIGDFNASRFEHQKIIEDGDKKYMAPEILLNKNTCSSDIFSLGMIYLELCSGALLPDRGDSWGVFRKNNIKKMNLSKYFTDQEDIDLFVRMIDNNFKRRICAEELVDYFQKLCD